MERLVCCVLLEFVFVCVAVVFVRVLRSCMELQGGYPNLRFMENVKRNIDII